VPQLFRKLSLRLWGHRQQSPQDRIAPLGNLIVVAFLIAHTGRIACPHLFRGRILHHWIMKYGRLPS
jgi:hypothetical protein